MRTSIFIIMIITMEKAGLSLTGIGMKLFTIWFIVTVLVDIIATNRLLDK